MIVTFGYSSLDKRSINFPSLKISRHLPEKTDIDKLPSSSISVDRDEHIAKALQLNNHEAIGLIYDKYASTFFGLLQKITDDTDQAEMVLQSCFLSFWRNRHLYEPARGNLLGWMLTIIRKEGNEAIAKRIGNYREQPTKDEEQYKKWKRTVEHIFLGRITITEAAGKMGITVPETRQFIHKEVNKLRGLV